MYSGVPSRWPDAVIEPPPATRATPKSSTFRRRSASIIMFCGLTSRWTIPSACADPSALSS